MRIWKILRKVFPFERYLSDLSLSEHRIPSFRTSSAGGDWKWTRALRCIQPPNIFWSDRRDDDDRVHPRAIATDDDAGRFDVSLPPPFCHAELRPSRRRRLGKLLIPVCLYFADSFFPLFSAAGACFCTGKLLRHERWETMRRCEEKFNTNKIVTFGWVCERRRHGRVLQHVWAGCLWGEMNDT